MVKPSRDRERGGFSPPRKADWSPGQRQVGIFIRTEEGRELWMVDDDASHEDYMLAFLVVRGAKALGPELRAALQERYQELLREAASELPQEQEEGAR